MFKICTLLIVAALVLVDASTISRQVRQTDDEQIIRDAEKEIMNTIDSIWGGSCVTDDQCLQFISHCKRSSTIQPIGECALNWWSWLILGLIVLLIVGSCAGCCLLQCCCLYKCCQFIFDCLCCCCRNKGYSPANRG